MQADLGGGAAFIDIIDHHAFGAVFHLTVAERGPCSAGIISSALAVEEVLLSSVTSTSTGFPSRSRPSLTLVPGSVVAMRERSSANCSAVCRSD
jgi:hypothetical protein